MTAIKKFLGAYGIWLILLLAFALRVAMTVQGYEMPLKWDELAYAKRARDILANVFAYRDVLRAPVYPFFLAVIFESVGQTRFAVGIIQSGISTVLVATIFALTRMLFARKSVALLAALFAALYFEFLTLARIVMSETLFMVLSVIGIALLFHAWKHKRAREFIPAGIALALAALTRELFSYFVVLVLPAWLVLATYKTPRQLGRNLVALAFGLALVFAPWVARNYAIEHRFILATTHSEIDLLRDNWRIELRAQGLGGRQDNLSMAKRVRKTLAQVPGSERSVFVLGRALQVMTRYPREWVSDKFSRLSLLWRPFALEARVVRLENIAQPWRGFLQQVVSYSAVVLLFLGTFGILIARNDAPKLLIALYILYSLGIFLMTHYLPRFRLPLLVVLLPYAAFAVVESIHWLRAPNWKIISQHRGRAFSVALVLGLFLLLTR